MNSRKNTTPSKNIKNSPKIIVVMPAYNAETTLEKTFSDIPKKSVTETILVDDYSTDNTISIAQKLKITVVSHDCHKGYGANQKTCYNLALKKNADIIVMLHPDYQYDSRIIPYCVGFITTGICDVIIGSRIRTRRETLQSGMPVYKYIANRILTIFENFVLGQNLGDFHSGFRIYTRRVLETLPFKNNSDDFVFDTEFITQAVFFNFRIGDVPIPTRYFLTASSINFRRSVKYGIQTIGVMIKYILQKWHIISFKIFNGYAQNTTNKDTNQ